MELSKRDEILKYLQLSLLHGKPEEIFLFNNNALPSIKSHTLYKKALFLFAFRYSFTVAGAVRKTVIDRTTVYDWYNNDENFKALFDEVKEMKMDFIEDAAFQCIREKGVGYARLIEVGLRTICKSRGYTEEVTSYEDEIVEFTLNPGRKLLKGKDDEVKP